MFAKSNLHNNLDLLPDLSNKKLYFVCTTKLDPVEISPIWRAFSLCSRCNNPHVYHVNVAFTLKIYQISGLTNTFCAHKYFSYLFTKFDGEQICFSGVVVSLEIISEAWRSLAVLAHFDIVTIFFLQNTLQAFTCIGAFHLNGISLFFGVKIRDYEICTDLRYWYLIFCVSLLFQTMHRINIICLVHNQDEPAHPPQRCRTRKFPL